MMAKYNPSDSHQTRPKILKTHQLSNQWSLRLDRKTVDIIPDDIEIVKTGSGEILTIFPIGSAEDTLEDILVGLYLLKQAQLQPEELDEILKGKEQANYLIMAFAEVKRIMALNLKDGEKFALTFMEQIERFAQADSSLKKK